MVNITISQLDIGQCKILSLPWECDRAVFCSDGRLEWLGACPQNNIQKCVEHGLSLFAKENDG